MRSARDTGRDPPTGGLTIGSLWETVLGARELDDDVLHWPPDVFGLIDRVLDVSEAYRFVVSPPVGVALRGMGSRSAPTAREWWEFLDHARDGPPEVVLQLWKVVRDASDLDLEELATGTEWDVIEALLRLHAISDESCAGLGSALAAPAGSGYRFRAEARELFAATGSVSRLSPAVIRVIPRCRASVGGISLRSLSRHVCARGPQVDVEWHRMLSQPTGVKPPQAHANVLLLPWPLRVRSRDFRAVSYSLPHMDPSRFGFFTFDPEERLDLDLVEGVLRAATDEAGTVDSVKLPEAAVTPDDIAPLEALLGEYGVWNLITGVRKPPSDGELGGNWAHFGVRQEVVWRHAIQHKHHRWRLDGSQISQYHLGGALSPTMTWWEAVSVPRRSLQVIDQGAITMAPLICEDLARLEPVAELMRSIGPSLVSALLLDGPQLASRWTARYASVLADDPGSAVLTLSSYGMVRRCRPAGLDASGVVALWKDATGGLTEIELDDGAHAVLIATHVTGGDSATADGRRHTGATSTLALAGVQSVTAHAGASRRPTRPSTPSAAEAGGGSLPPLDEREVSKATSWAEAVAEAATSDPVGVHDLLDHAIDPAWREPLGLRPPGRLFVDSISSVRRELPDHPQPPTFDHVLAAAGRMVRAGDPAVKVTGRLLEIALEHRLFTEVLAGRLPPDSLESLSAL